MCSNQMARASKNATSFYHNSSISSIEDAVVTVRYMEMGRYHTEVITRSLAI